MQKSSVLAPASETLHILNQHRACCKILRTILYDINKKTESLPPFMMIIPIAPAGGSSPARTAGLSHAKQLLSQPFQAAVPEEAHPSASR